MARTHGQIVKDAGRDPEVADAIGAKSHQVRDWRLRNSIPKEWWNLFAEHGYATLKELADSADIRVAPTDQRPAA